MLEEGSISAWAKIQISIGLANNWHQNPLKQRKICLTRRHSHTYLAGQR
jgi:hypothetical protein